MTPANNARDPRLRKSLNGFGQAVSVKDQLHQGRIRPSACTNALRQGKGLVLHRRR